jgi:glycosyltransferase involved in cell wall biosynthesis
MYVGSFKGSEGLDILISSAATVSEVIPDVLFVFIGEGGIKEELFNIVKGTSLEKVILFLGSVEHNEVPYYLSAADVLISVETLQVPGIPNKILEYGAARKAVITTKNIAQEFLKLVGITPSEYLYIIETELNDKALSDAIITLYKDKNLRERIAENFFLIVKNYFSSETIAKRYLSHMKRLHKLWNLKEY